MTSQKTTTDITREDALELLSATGDRSQREDANDGLSSFKTRQHFEDDDAETAENSGQTIAAAAGADAVATAWEERAATTDLSPDTPATSASAVRENAHDSGPVETTGPDAAGILRPTAEATNSAPPQEVAADDAPREARAPFQFIDTPVADAPSADLREPTAAASSAGSSNETESAATQARAGQEAGPGGPSAASSTASSGSDSEKDVEERAENDTNEVIDVAAPFETPGAVSPAPSNTAPAAADDAGVVAEGSAGASGDVLANDADPDAGAVLIVAAVDGDSAHVGAPVAGSYGTITLGADGAYSYVLDNANPAVQALNVGDTLTDAFSYTVTDEHGAEGVATLSVTVAGTNDAPTITSGGAGSVWSFSVDEQNTDVATVAVQDADTGATLTYSLIGGADQALFQIDANSGALSFLSAPSFEHDSSSDGDLTYEVVVQIEDEHGATDTKTLNVTVDDVAEALAVSGVFVDAGVAETSIVGGATDDTITGATGSDDISGGGGDDILIGGGDDDVIDGGGGADVAEFSGDWSDYSITENAGVYTVADQRTGSPDGADTLRDIETFRFADGDVAVAQSVNVAPTDLVFDNTTVAEHAAAGTLVAKLSVVDANTSDQHSLSIVTEMTFAEQLAADPSAQMALDYAGSDSGKAATGLRLNSIGRVEDADGATHTVWRIRNSNDTMETVTLDAYSGTIPD